MQYLLQGGIMSGGHFDYAFYTIKNFYENLEEEIENNNKKDKFGFSYNYCEETIKKLKEIVEYLKLAKEYMYAVEWLYSGDFGEDDLLEYCKEQELKVGNDKNND